MTPQMSTSGAEPQAMQRSRLGSAMALGDAGVLAPGRLRPLRALGWMIALAAGVILISSLPSILGLRPIAPPARILVALLMSLVAIVAYAATIRRFERRVPMEVAVTAMTREGGLGLLIGLAMFAVVMLSLYAFGLYSIHAERWTNWSLELTSAVQTGLIEELLLRAIIFRLLMRAFGPWPAIILSGALFGALHLAGPHATLVAGLAIALEAGCMLASAYLLTGRIWLPVGIHIGWNFAEGSIFSASVSGHDTGGGLFVSAPSRGAPDILTGGTFGPEGSLSSIIVGLVLFCVFMILAYRQRSA